MISLYRAYQHLSSQAKFEGFDNDSLVASLYCDALMSMKSEQLNMITPRKLELVFPGGVFSWRGVACVTLNCVFDLWCS